MKICKTISLKNMLLMALLLNLTACSIVSEVVNHEANDQRLLKAGALDVSIAEIYLRYQYKFLDKYQISHDFVMTGGCSYYGPPVGIKDIIPGTNYAIRPATDIFEKDNHTWQETIYGRSDPRNIDRYTRPEWQNGTDANGKPRIAKGFQSMCSQSWYSSQHVLNIELRKQNIDDLMAAAKKYDPKLVFETRVVNGNKWQVRFSDLGPAPLNGAGGPFQTWLLPIGDTGYTFIFGLGANQDSLKYPQAHAQMQAIFKHLIESVKIEPNRP